MEVKELQKQEKMYWGTWAKTNWLKWGDRNSKYFHTSTIRRREINTIHRKKDSHDNWLYDPDEIKQAFKCHFNDLFNSLEGEIDDRALQHISPLVTPQDIVALLKEIHENEVKAAVFSIGAHKAPGPDGLNGVFYQKS